MKKLVIFIVLILTPLTILSQENNEPIVRDVIVLNQLDVTSTLVVSNKRNHTHFLAQKDVIELSHKKSIDLTSIRAFRKATQLKSKNSNHC